MKILAFDTTNSTLSVALLEDQNCLEKITIEESSKQSELLIPTIEILLNNHQIWYQDLGLIAATKGPGSFTGIRVGISVIKAMQVALETPVILLDTLFVIANKHAKKSGKIIAILDARMDEFFIAEFLASDGEITATSPSKLIKIDELEKFSCREKFYMCGNGKEIASSFFKANDLDFEILKEKDYLEADLVGAVGYKEFIKNKSGGKSDAFYLRDARITERKK